MEKSDQGYILLAYSTVKEKGQSSSASMSYHTRREREDVSVVDWMAFDFLKCGGARDFPECNAQIFGSSCEVDKICSDDKSRMADRENDFTRRGLPGPIQQPHRTAYPANAFKPQPQTMKEFMNDSKQVQGATTVPASSMQSPKDGGSTSRGRRKSAPAGMEQGIRSQSRERSSSADRERSRSRGRGESPRDRKHNADCGVMMPGVMKKFASDFEDRVQVTRNMEYQMNLQQRKMGSHEAARDRGHHSHTNHKVRSSFFPVLWSLILESK